MKIKSFNFSRGFPFLFSFLIMWGSSLLVFSQTPRGVPHPEDNEPLQLDNLTNIIVFVILPVLLGILYFWLKRRKNRRSNKP